MKLEDLQQELDEDLILDHTKLEYESGKNPVLYGKWLRHYSDCKRQILKYDIKKRQAIKEKLDYYTGRSDEVSMVRYEKSEMKTVLSADDEILKVDTTLQYWNILLDFCSSAMEAIKGKGFAIKNAIEIRKFEAGS